MSKRVDTKIIARSRWYAAYEAALVAECPRLAGKVDWDTANYFFHLGRDAKEAATLIARRFNEEHKPRCRHRDDGRGRCIDCDEFI